MRFSVAKNDSLNKFMAVNAYQFNDYATHITYYNYSPSVFKDGLRSNKNFLCADSIALDFDGGLTLSEAKLRFASYRHVIAPTRSHQVEKNGEITDRFRVILPLESTITKAEDYKATVEELLKQNPEADRACKDPARMFYPSKYIESFKEKGRSVQITHGKPKEKKELIISTGEKGKLGPTTHEFLLFGAPQGERHHQLFRAVKDMQGQNYSFDEIVSLVSEMITRTGNWAHQELTDKDIQTIKDAYTSDNDDKHREKEKPAFNFVKIGELYKQEIKIDWLVSELLIEGGISILAARPKSGKSTLVRQLTKAVCRGEEFLNRKVEKGKVAYLAIEEHPAMLKHQFKTIGITDKDDIMIHVGPIYGKNSSDSLIHYLQDYNANLVIIDTLALFAGITDINSYNEVNPAMQQVREIARKTGAHVMLVHHTTKSEVSNVNSIMGSQAFLGAVDTAMIINCVGNRRFLTSTGRGLTNYQNAEIIYNKDNETYSLGKIIEDF